jgi:hypothetical protein
MPTDLPHDGGHRERDEVGAGFHVEARDGVDQSDASHLDQVVAGFSAALEPAGYVVGQRQTAFDDFVPMTLEVRGARVESSQLTKHVRNVGVFVGTR